MLQLPKRICHTALPRELPPPDRKGLKENILSVPIVWVQLCYSSMERDWTSLWGEAGMNFALLTLLMFWGTQNTTRLLYSVLFLLVPTCYNSVSFLKWLLQGAALWAQPASGVPITEGIPPELSEQGGCCGLPVPPLAQVWVIQVTCCHILSSVLPALVWIFRGRPLGTQGQVFSFSKILFQILVK